MKQKLLNLKSWLLMMCLLVGVGSAWAEDLVVTYDFTSADNYPSGFPTSNKNTCETETGYTFGGNSIYFKTANSGNFYQASTGSAPNKLYSVFLGKNVKYNEASANTIASTAYMKIPGKTGYKITKLVVTNATNAAVSGINLAVCNSSYQMVIPSAVASSTSEDMTFKINSEGTTLAENEAAYFCMAPTTAAGKNLNVQKIVVTYTPCEASVEYNVNIANNILNGTVDSDVASAAEGTTVTLTAKPRDGYKLKSWDVTNASTGTSIDVTNNQFKMPAADVNVSAFFTEIPTHTITWSVNGNTTTIAPTLVEDGTEISFPTELDDIYGKKFVGWSDNVNASSASDLISGKVVASADATYYAVYATVTQGEQMTATLRCGATTANTTYAQSTTKDSKDYEWKLYTNFVKQSINNVDHYYYGLNSNSKGYNIESPEFSGNIVSIKAYVWNTNSNTDRKAFLCSSDATKQPTTGDLGEMEINRNTKYVEQSFDIITSKDFKKFYIYASTDGAIGFESIEVTYGDPDVVSDYTTKPAAITKYNVTILTDEIVNGTVTTDQKTAAEGETVTLTITPDEGYSLAQLMVYTADTYEDIDVEDNSFVMPAADVEIYAYFAPEVSETYTLNEFAEAANAEEDAITPGSMVSVSFDNEIVQISNEDGYVVLKDGDNTFALIAEESCSSDWKVGGTLAGTWKAQYYGKYPDGAYALYFVDENDPWADLEYTAPAEITYTPQTLTLVAQDEEECYWATFSSNKVTFWPNDVTVNTVVVESGEIVMFAGEDGVFEEGIDDIDDEHTIDGYYVPANTGILVSSIENAATYYTVENKNVDDVDSDFNMLHPASRPKSELSGYLFYKLAYASSNLDDLGFYWGGANGGAFDSREGSAYLAIPEDKAAKISGFRLTDDGATDINAVQNVNDKASVVYNLNGQRISSAGAFRGIVIVNGKKMLNK